MELLTTNGKGDCLPVTQFFFWTILLLFLTQNCGAPNDESVGDSIPSGEVRAASLGDVNLSRLLVFQLESHSVQMDILSGELVASGDPDQVGFCLVEDTRSEIEALLKNHGICQTDHTYPENLLCSQLYKFPYLEVFIGEGDELTPLGEETSGCPEQSIHLCEGDNILEALFRGLIFPADFKLCQN